MKNNTVDKDAEVRDYLHAAGIQLNERELELLKKCSGYAERLIDRGANTWPQGFPLISKTTAKPAAKTFDDIAARIWNNRRNSPRKGERNVKKAA